MTVSTLPVVTTYALVLVLGTAGIIQLTGVAVVRATYLGMDYSARAYRLIGAVELLAACLLAVSGLRPMGVVVAAAVNFLAVALLLKNRKYLLAAPGLMVMVALPFVFLTVH